MLCPWHRAARRAATPFREVERDSELILVNHTRTLMCALLLSPPIYSKIIPVNNYKNKSQRQIFYFILFPGTHLFIIISSGVGQIGALGSEYNLQIGNISREKINMYSSVL